jgi:glycosyltransferase involved in cell wall biosynthesis
MKILMVHKFYYIEGGAERYYFNLSELLEREGHTVIPFAMQHPRNLATPWSRYFVDYFEPDKELAHLGPVNGIKAAARVVYNRQARNKIEALIDEVQPDIAHVHGVYHHLSPSVLFSLKKKRLPVIFTLHEYKILCPDYLFLDREGRVCEQCEGRHFWHATAKRCFRNSLPASALVTVESYVHRLLKTYRNQVDLYLSPSRFLQGKMIQYGYPEEKVEWLPYTIPMDHYEPCYENDGYFVYVGRLSHEKGIAELVHAMKRVPAARLKVIGTGRLGEPLQKFVQDEGLKNVEFLGYKSGEDLREIVRRAMFVAVPSVVYDNSPLTIYEAFAHGKPVVGAAIGGIPELIDEGRDGFLFTAGDEGSLVKALERMRECAPQWPEMGRAGRQKAEALFGPEAHLQRMEAIYRRFLRTL